MHKFTPLNETGEDFKFALGVVEFCLLLRDSKFKGNATFSQALDFAIDGSKKDKYGYRKEFIKLLNIAKRLKSMKTSK
jgi:Ca-activated chloride channel family protein